MFICEVFLLEVVVNVYIEGVVNFEFYCGIGLCCVFMFVYVFKIRFLIMIFGDFCYIEIFFNDLWNGVK